MRDRHPRRKNAPAEEAKSHLRKRMFFAQIAHSPVNSDRTLPKALTANYVSLTGVASLVKTDLKDFQHAHSKEN